MGCSNEQPFLYQKEQSMNFKGVGLGFRREIADEMLEWKRWKTRFY